MGIWYFWEQYEQALRALDKFPEKEVQEPVFPAPVRGDTSLLGRETESLTCSNKQQEMVSRFLYCIQQMPRAWGSRPWSSHELLKAGNNVANDLFRRKMKRELKL